MISHHLVVEKVKVKQDYLNMFLASRSVVLFYAEPACVTAVTSFFLIIM